MADPAQDAPRRRFFDLRAGAPTLIGIGSRFEGTLEVQGPMSLGGTIVGHGRVAGPVSIAQDAHWQGNVHAHSAVVAGRVTGDMTIETKLEISKSAVIRGRVRAHVVAIADGAIVEGEISVTGSQPIIHFEEKRAPRTDPGG
ncbi:MAG TPA: polymer-forming cytoskeletal protein [Steroidobacteraceae bacterium]|nr:polymer-forming cytoskeletal protein [Steroidobacteraceae bacterium]